MQVRACECLSMFVLKWVCCRNGWRGWVGEISLPSRWKRSTKGPYPLESQKQRLHVATDFIFKKNRERKGFSRFLSLLSSPSLASPCERGSLERAALTRSKKFGEWGNGGWGAQCITLLITFLKSSWPGCRQSCPKLPRPLPLPAAFLPTSQFSKVEKDSKKCWKLEMNI